jgi:DNA (cytosine-5)-methyltransferase 1
MKEPEYIRPRRLKALDLFCGAGGASKGLHEAGYQVYGVDISPQPNYPFTFIEANALEYRISKGAFDLIWASPPCQPFTVLRHRVDLSKYEDLIRPTRALLKASGVPYVIENVPGAPLRTDFFLCGEMFGLRSYRHRIFECSFKVPQKPHPQHVMRVNRRGENRKKHWESGGHITITGDIGTYVGPEAMGIDWMTGNELSQAIPPVYAKYIARYSPANQSADHK